MTTLALSDVRKRLKAAIAAAGNAAKLSREHGVSPSLISRTMKGDKPSGAVLKMLGLAEVERAPRYQEADK